jgi:hypothetical protein
MANILYKIICLLMAAYPVVLGAAIYWCDWINYTQFDYALA